MTADGSGTTTALSGLTRFARYAFMPNRLGYCGGGDNRALYDYVVADQADRGLAEVLSHFTGAMPYLRLIARSSGLADPFHPKVVEAYWVGNELLRQVEARQLYDHLADRFARQLSPRMRQLVLGKAPAGARPHHSFHVLDVYRRTAETEQTLRSLDSCRISWARVQRVEGAGALVERQPLELQAGKLALGEPQLENALRQLDGRGFADAASTGDWVSMHWGWVCEVLSESGRVALEGYTRRHLALANATL